MAIEVNESVVEYFGTPTNTTHTINLSTASEGDVRVVVIAANPDGTGTVPTVNIPSGWTQIGSQLNTGAASDGMLCIIYRVVQIGDGNTLVTTYTQTCMVATICTTYEGVDNDTPIDQTTPTFSTGTGNPVCPTITTQTDGARVGRPCLLDGAPGFSDTSIPTGTTLRGTMVNNPPSNGQNLGHADEEQVTAGSAGTATWSDGATEEYVSATFALRPRPDVVYDLSGITYSQSGAVLGSCTLALFKDNLDDTLTVIGYTRSDSVDGTYTFTDIIDKDSQYIIRAWKDDSPHVFDVTDHNLAPSVLASAGTYDLYLRSDSGKGETSPSYNLRLRSDLDKLGADPYISNMEDEDFYEDETDVIITGGNFLSTEGSVVLGNNAVWGSVTVSAAQIVNTWADNSINIDIVKGALDYGYNWTYVTNTSGASGSGYQINIYKELNITDVSPNKIYNTLTGVVITGFDFSSSKGAGEKVELHDTTTFIEQVITNWSSNSITFTVSAGSLNPDSTIYCRVTRSESSSGDQSPRASNDFQVDLIPQPAWEYSISTQPGFDDGVPITVSRLTSGGKFTDGSIWETVNPSGSNTLDVGEFTEYEFSIRATTESESGVQYEFRLVDEDQAGEKYENYDVIAKITLS